MLRGFSYVDAKAKLQMDDEFGTIEKVSDEPLTVKYTFNDKAVWSDGQPIGCADFLLAWMSGSGRYNKDGTTNTPGNDPGRADLPVRHRDDQRPEPDPEADLRGRRQDGHADLRQAVRRLAGGHLTSAGAQILPAHVAAKAAGTDTAGLVTAYNNNDIATLTKIADFWNTGWTLDKAKGLPDASIIPSAGPYYVAAWDPGQSVTLKKNDKWWGTPPKTDTIVIRYISQDQQVAALASGEVDVIEPQPNPDINSALDALGSSVKADHGSDFTYEHMDLSVKNGFANEKLREALFKCAPRQQIVDNLVVPSSPDAQVLQSLMVMDFQDGYDQVAAASGFENYTQPDIEGAKAAYAASGEAQGKTIRVIHVDPNPRRTNEVALLKASCDPVGFNIQDVPLSTADFGPARAKGDYDIALLAWAGSGLLGSISSLYASNGQQNSAGWNDPQLDTALNSLNTLTDPSQAQNLLITADQRLAANYYTFPIFTFPSVTAMKTNIDGPVENSTQTQATWNMQDWVRTG